MQYSKFKSLQYRCLSVNIEKGTFTLPFSNNFFNYKKIWFHAHRFTILCIFPAISFWSLSIFFPSFFLNHNQSGLKKVLGIKLLDKSIVPNKRWKRNKVNVSIKQKLHMQEQEFKSTYQPKTHTIERKIKSATVLPNITLCVWNSTMFPIILYKLQTCSNNFYLTSVSLLLSYYSRHVAHLYFIKNLF